MRKITLLICLASIISCKHDPIIISDFVDDDPITVVPNGSPFSCSEDTVYFNEQILPIFFNSCAVSGCHDVETHEEDLILDSYDNIIASDEIFAFDTSEGDIYEVITEDIDDEDFMPPTDSEIDPLTSGEILLISTWINQGLLNNSCPDLICDTVEVTFSGDIFPMMDSYCSGCHTGSVVNADVHLGTYNEIKFQASTGAIIGTISNADGYAVMPSNTSGLTDCQIRMVEIWIEDGTPDN